MDDALKCTSIRLNFLMKKQHCASC